MGTRRGRAPARPGPAAAAGALVLAVAGALASPAAGAVDPAAVDDGLWYHTRTGVAEAHARTTGGGVTIAVLDTMINPDAPDLAGSGVQVTGTCRADDGSLHPATSTGEDARHGTEVTALLVGTGAGAAGQPGVRGVAPGATVLYYAVTPPGAVDGAFSGPTCSPVDGVLGVEIADAIDQAVASGADIITTSMSHTIWGDAEVDALLRAYAAGAVVVAAAPNEMPPGGSLGDPAGLNGVVAVGRHDIDGVVQDFLPASSPYLTVVAPGMAVRAPSLVDGSWERYALVNGTSYATPWTAGVLALAWSLSPDATGNQVIQALVRTTATAPEDGTPEHDDEYGYGPVSVARLLAADPTALPDENPLLRPLDDDEARPTTQEVLEATGVGLPEPPGPAASPEPTTEPAPPADGDDGGGTARPALPVLLGGATALLVAAAVAAVALRRRSAAAATATGTTATGTTATGTSREDS